MNRRRFLALGSAAGTAGLAGCSFRQSETSARQDGPTVALDPVVEGISFPTSMVFLPDDSHLITERAGFILRHTAEGVTERPFLDLTDRLDGLDGEKGLLSMELHPDFPEDPRLFVRYSGAPPTESTEYSHTAVLSEFEVTDDYSGVVDGSERRILGVPEPGHNHNAGDLAFGPEGYLYIPLGDGQRTGAESDAFWWYEQGEAAQQLDENLLGGLLRIDVDTTTEDSPYGIPSDNPLVGSEGRDEYYAWGLRNPYRISFDGERLFIGDVGEHIRESVYIGERGANYGWPIYEGSSCGTSISIGHAVADNPLNFFNPKSWVAQTNRISPAKVCPATNELRGTLRDPLVEYHRNTARAVTGGYVYRGDAIPALQGAYIFGDLIPPGPMFAVEDATAPDPEGTLTELTVQGTENGHVGDMQVSYARDPSGEVYLLSSAGAEGTGRIRRLAAAE